MQYDDEDTYEYKGLRISITQDECADSPLDWDTDNSVFIVTSRNRYFEVIPKGYSVEAIAEHMETHKLYMGKFKVFPLYAYVHSGVALSLGRGYPFDCPWDSGQIGYVLVDRRKSVIPDADEAAECEVKTWNQYLSGDVWQVSVKDDAGNVLESVGGFYGHKYAKAEAESMADACAESLAKDFSI